MDSLNLLRKGGTDFLCPINLDSLDLEGHYGSKMFTYFEIVVLGCNLDEGKCLPDTEIDHKEINFVSLKASPSLIDNENNTDKVISYHQDFTYFREIDTSSDQRTNIFFQKSLIRLKDDILDFLDIHEIELPLYQTGHRENY